MLQLLRNRARQLPRYARLHIQDWWAGKQLRLVQDRRTVIGTNDIILVACLRNEVFRMEAFVEWYRRLGVRHFLFVDNGSTDNFMDWAARQSDVSVWYTEASYKNAHFGMLWCNDLLRRYGHDRWCVCVDPDEFLVYPYMETRNLPALTRFLDEERRLAFHCILLDSYSRKPLSDAVLKEGQDPFAVCPWFDRDGYLQKLGWGDNITIRGGPRQRVYFKDHPEDAPALNKIPLVRWKQHYHYHSSMHDAWPFRLNRPRGHDAITGALFHFKFVASLAEKAEEEMQRGQHFADSVEYAAYNKSVDPEFYREGISVRYEGSGQLVDLGLMSKGKWF